MAYFAFAVVKDNFAVVAAVTDKQDSITDRHPTGKLNIANLQSKRLAGTIQIYFRAAIQQDCTPSPSETFHHPMLSTAEIEQYRREGYITPSFRLPESMLSRIRNSHEQLVEKHPEFSDYCPALLAYDTDFLEVAKTSEILTMVSQLIGDDIALWNSSFFAKPARTGTKTPWHQDGEYWPIEPLATCTVWIAIDASTPANGCLQVIPGSHRNRTLAQHQRNTAEGLALPLELDASTFDESKAVNITLEPGQISLHDVYLFHGSDANKSEHSRRGMTLRYMPTTSVYRHADAQNSLGSGKLDLSQRTVYLMKGVDRSGQNDFGKKH
ncbi:MAG: phytanoyl-CoA dioxygenase family protein [Rubripirellula sp.]